MERMNAVKNVPYAPGGLPVAGHIPAMLRTPLEFLQSLRTRGDMVRLRLGPTPTYVVNEPDLIRQVLVTDAHDYDKGIQFDQLRVVMGNGLLTSKGDFHRGQRRLIQPAFHRDRIKGYVRVMRDHAARAAESWHEGQVIRIRAEMLALSLANLSKTVFHAGIAPETVAEIERIVGPMLRGLVPRMFDPTGLYGRLPLPANRRFNTNLRRFDEIIGELILQQRAEDRDRGDMLSMLMLARDEETGEPMTDGQIRDELVTMLLNGIETAANTLAFTFYVLSTHSEIEWRLCEEVDAVLAGRPIEMDDIGRMEYLSRVLTETLRRYPQAWMLTRRAIADVELGGYHVPARSSIIFNTYALLQDPQLFPDPGSVDPDRWLPERAGHLPQCAYIPFGMGARKCIGDSFAWTEMVATVATILQRRRLRPQPHSRLRLIPSTTLTLRDLPMIVSSGV